MSYYNYTNYQPDHYNRNRAAMFHADADERSFQPWGGGPSARAQRRRAMQAEQMANMNEMAQIMDRKMDIAENEQGRKRAEVDNAYAVGMEDIAAKERMNKDTNRSLSNLGSIGGGNTTISDPGVNGVNLYDSAGNRIGGSWLGQSLLRR